MTIELINKIERFKNSMLKELNNNEHKGSILDFGNFESIITELEYHKAKALIAIRLNNKQAVKEYIADTANILFALGNAGGLYDDDFEESDKPFELRKDVDIFVNVEEPALNQSINNNYKK